MSDDACESVPAAAAPPPREALVPDALAVRFSSDRAVVPTECACCGDVGSRTVREARLLDGALILVPYCGECHRHVSRSATRRIAVGLSAVLLTSAFAFGAPFVIVPRGFFWFFTLVCAGALFPLFVSWRFPQPRAGGHAVAGRAVFFRYDGALVCAVRSWGERLARESGLTSCPVTFRERVYPAWAAAFSTVVLLATPFVYRFHFPAIRIIDVADRPLVIRVDGRIVARVEATSGESPTAGASVRVRAGRRTFTATDPEGRVRDVRAVDVHPGGAHLYAPDSDGTCFWVETTGYGRRLDVGTERASLPADTNFWELPLGVDFWFAPPPPPGTDGYSTGGIVRALRQSRCDEAPEGVR